MEDQVLETRKPKTKADDSKRIRIIIHAGEGEQGHSDVAIGVNDNVCQIKRGVEVDVRPEVLDVLKNCVQTVFERNSEGRLEERDVQRFPYSVISG